MQAARPLTETELCALFEDSFGPWSTVATCVRPPFRGCQRVDGDVLLDGEIVGRFARRVNEGGESVYHIGLELDEHARGKGFASQWVNRCRTRYRAAGIERIDVDATEDGRMVWARMGFEAEQVDWIDLLERADLVEGLDLRSRARLTALREQPPRVLALVDVQTNGRSVLEQLDWTGSMVA